MNEWVSERETCEHKEQYGMCVGKMRPIPAIVWTKKGTKHSSHSATLSLSLFLISIFTCSILSLSHASYSHCTIEVYVGSGNIEQTKRLPVKHTCDGHFNVTLKRAHTNMCDCVCVRFVISVCAHWKRLCLGHFQMGTSGQIWGWRWGGLVREKNEMAAIKFTENSEKKGWKCVIN